MKKSVNLMVMFICAFSCYAQVNLNSDSLFYREYEDRYMLPEVISEGYVSLDCFDTVWGCLDANQSNPQFQKYKVLDVAQQYYADKKTEIAGISAFFYIARFSYMNAYLCIADSNFNIVKKVKVPTYMDPNHDWIHNNVKEYCRYMELFFDSSVTVQGKFYVLTDYPKPYPYTGYNWTQITDDEHARNLFWGNVAVPSFSTTCKLNEGKWFFRRIYVDSGEDFDTVLIDEDWDVAPSYNRVPLIFPIMAESNQDSSSLNESVLENVIAVFPNPAKDLVSVKSPEKIISIEITNSLGQTTDVIAVNNYTKTINVEDYPKGNYIISIKTSSGFAIKKLIIK